MATISKEEATLQRHLQKEGLSLDKFPSLKTLVLAAMDERAKEAKAEKSLSDKDGANEALHAKRLARSVESLLTLVPPDMINNYGYKEARIRLKEYKKAH